MNEHKEWWKKAKGDLDVAKYTYKGKKYNATIFFCQQAAEKSLKSLLLKKKGKIIKTHDLVILAKRLKTPKDIVEHAKELTLAYTYVRYPDIPEIKDIKNKAKLFLDYAEGVVKWTKKSLKT